MVRQSLADLNLQPIISGVNYFPSSIAWNDFRLFRVPEQLQKDSHIWFCNKVVTLLDDHDRIDRRRAHFCADQNTSRAVLNVLALNALTLRIPCIYYGSEQCFDRKHIVLRRGRQYLREISAPENGVNFGLPEMIGGQIHSVVPWSQIFNDQEMLLTINTDYDQPRTAWMKIDNDLHKAGDHLRCIYSTDAAQIRRSVTVKERNGKAVLITVPATGFVIFE